jgi:hypothetical protein
MVMGVCKTVVWPWIVVFSVGVGWMSELLPLPWEQLKPGAWLAADVPEEPQNPWQKGASFPVEQFTAYTSPFGYRQHPMGGYRFHYGLDLAAPLGSYIRRAFHFHNCTPYIPANLNNFAESKFIQLPLLKDLQANPHAGTDDGLIQVTEDGGANWRKVDFSKIPGLPITAFVNDIKADLYDENTVYAVFDNHKFGDFKAYIYKSTDKGKSWTSIASNLPEKTLVWRMVQDHVSPNLLFLGTEFGVYVSIDGGKAWTKMTGGMPNISVRDLAIQKRENDLVLATFGRGFYILDDYTALRNLSKETLEK